MCFYFFIILLFRKTQGRKEGRERDREGERLRLREKDERGQRVLKRSIGQIVFVRTPFLRIGPKFGLLCTKRN